VSFHIEVSSGLTHARSFNLSEEELRRTVLEPWLSGGAIRLGDRRWDREESRLRILEGGELSNPELAFGQGWANAERASADVTSALLAEAAEARAGAPGPAAVVVEADSPAQALAEMLAGRATRDLDAAEATRRLGRGDPDIEAVILVVRRPGA
jgi:hypothetical protein